MFSLYPSICFISQYRKWACCHWSFTKTLLKLVLTRLGFLKAGAVSGHRHFSVFPTPLLLLQEDRWPFWAPYQTQVRACFSQAPTVWKPHSRLSSRPCPKLIWEWPDFPTYSAQCVHPVGPQAKSITVSAEDTKLSGKPSICLSRTCEKSVPACGPLALQSALPFSPFESKKRLKGKGKSDFRMGNGLLESS